MLHQDLGIDCDEYEYLCEIENRVYERRKGYGNKSQAQRLISIIHKMEKYYYKQVSEERKRRKKTASYMIDCNTRNLLKIKNLEEENEKLRFRLVLTFFAFTIMLVILCSVM